jgi:hypothetical protein
MSGWRADQILTSDAFGLDSSRDLATEQLYEDYRRSLARIGTDEDDPETRSRVESALRSRIPSSGETALQRETVAFLNKVAADTFAELTDEAQHEFVDAARRHLEGWREQGSQQ